MKIKFTSLVIFYILLIEISVAQKKNSLEGKKITNLEITCDNSIAKSPGNFIPIGVTATLDNKNELKTEGFLKGKTSWNDFIINVTGGSFNDGVVQVGPDPRTFKNHQVIIKVSDKFNDTIIKEIALDVNYDKNYDLDLSGKNGDDGEPGLTGKTGKDGIDGQSGDGQNGNHGQDGKNGKDGKNGGNGAKVTVMVNAYNDQVLNKKMLRIKIKNDDNGKEYYYTMYADKNILNLKANGGNGGNGGAGGFGGFGGNGGKGSYAQGSQSNPTMGRGGDGGNGGSGALGGNGGNGGNGGSMILIVDTSASAYASSIRFSNLRGKPGLQGNAGKHGDGGRAGLGGLGEGREGVYGQDGANGQDGVSGLDGQPAVLKNEAVTIDW